MSDSEDNSDTNEVETKDESVKEKDESAEKGKEESSNENNESGGSSEPAKAAPRKKYREDFIWQEQPIGRGAYGEVLLATDKETNITYAVKILNKKHIIAQKKVECVTREKVLLDMLRHPNIVNLYFTFSDPDNLHYVLEYCPHGELLDYIKKHKCFNLDVARFYSAEILSAIEFMHSKGVAHRDIKPENILLGNNMHSKIVDFGTAKQLGVANERSKSFVGTAAYVCPELLIAKEAGLSADLWSFGCMVYEFLSGQVPFKASTEYLTFQLIMNREFIFPENFPEVAKSLVEGLLALDPDERLGNRAEKFAELKAHPFFEGIDWDNLPNITPPPFAPPEVMPIFPKKEDPVSAAPLRDPEEERKEREAEERKQKLAEQKSSVWAKFLNDNELIVETALILKKRGMGKKKRQLILTDAPRLFYVDADKMVIKGEIPWGPELKAEAKGSKHFTVIVVCIKLCASF